MEAFKVEIIKEVRKEFQKMKQEIIDGMDILLQLCKIFRDVNAKIFALRILYFQP